MIKVKIMRYWYVVAAVIAVIIIAAAILLIIVPPGKAPVYVFKPVLKEHEFPAELLVNETGLGTLTITNIGNTSGVVNVAIKVENKVMCNETVTLRVNETKTIECNVKALKSGSNVITVLINGEEVLSKTLKGITPILKDLVLKSFSTTYEAEYKISGRMDITTVTQGRTVTMTLKFSSNKLTYGQYRSLNVNKTYVYGNLTLEMLMGPLSFSFKLPLEMGMKMNASGILMCMRMSMEMAPGAVQKVEGCNYTETKPEFLIGMKAAMLSLANFMNMYSEFTEVKAIAGKSAYCYRIYVEQFNFTEYVEYIRQFMPQVPTGPAPTMPEEFEYTSVNMTECITSDGVLAYLDGYVTFGKMNVTENFYKIYMNLEATSIKSGYFDESYFEEITSLPIKPLVPTPPPAAS